MGNFSFFLALSEKYFRKYSGKNITHHGPLQPGISSAASAIGEAICVG